MTQPPPPPPVSLAPNAPASRAMRAHALDLGARDLERLEVALVLVHRRAELAVRRRAPRRRAPRSTSDSMAAKRSRTSSRALGEQLGDARHATLGVARLAGVADDERQRRARAAARRPPARVKRPKPPAMRHRVVEAARLAVNDRLRRHRRVGAAPRRRGRARAPTATAIAADEPSPAPVGRLNVQRSGRAPARPRGVRIAA